MAIVRERIHLPSSQSFRLVHWSSNLHDMELVVSPQRRSKFDGEGGHWHYHEAFELTYFESGEGTRFVGDRIQPFQRGDLVLLGSNLPHYWHPRGRSSGWSLQWHLPPVHHFWAFPETKVLAPWFQGAARGIQFSGRTAEWLGAELRGLASTEGLARLGLLFRLLALAAGAPAAEQAFISENAFSLSAVSRHQGAMQAAIGFLLANFTREIRLNDLLEITRMSRPTFSRQFRIHSGKTLGQFLQQIRLAAACRELAETDCPIIDLALGNGFSQVSFFNRVFRRTFKCSPTDYRERAQSRRAGHGAGLPPTR
jgi:AraC-like DNA-binding protein/mannose-6-phosphate isomerase-like protein (cupin superfamily)